MLSTIKENIHLFRYEKNHDDLFEGCWPINRGDSINSYFVKGSSKKVLIDYVEAGGSFDDNTFNARHRPWGEVHLGF